MLKLVFLDGNTVGDVDLSGLKRFGNLEVFPLTKSSETPRPQGGASKTILTALETFLPHDDT